MSLICPHRERNTYMNLFVWDVHRRLNRPLPVHVHRHACMAAECECWLHLKFNDHLRPWQDWLCSTIYCSGHWLFPHKGNKATGSSVSQNRTFAFAVASLCGLSCLYVCVSGQPHRHTNMTAHIGRQLRTQTSWTGTPFRGFWHWNCSKQRCLEWKFGIFDVSCLFTFLK